MMTNRSVNSSNVNMLNGQNFKKPTNTPFRYHFPELKNAEIIQCLASLSIGISESDLIKPTVPVVQRVYETFLENYLGINPVVFQPVSPAHLPSLEYPEYFQESLALRRLYASLLPLMKAACIGDFGLGDLVRPEGGHFRAILSGLINYGRFCEDHLDFVKQHQSQTTEMMNELSRLKSQAIEFQNRIASIKSLREQEESKVILIKEKIGPILSEVRGELKREEANVITEYDSIKVKRDELAKKQSLSQNSLNSIRQDCQRLRSRVVHTPEKLKQIIADLHTKIDTERSSNLLLERKSREVQMKVEAYTRAKYELTHAIQLVEQIDAAIRRGVDAKSKLYTEQNALHSTQVELREASTTSKHLKRQTELSQEKLDKLHAKLEEVHIQMGQRQSHIDKFSNEVAEERKALLAKSESGERAIRDIEARMAELTKSHKADTSATLHNANALFATVNMFIQETGQVLNKNMF